MENLENADKKLSLLLEPKLKMALEDYVHKQDAQVRTSGTTSISLCTPPATYLCLIFVFRYLQQV